MSTPNEILSLPSGAEWLKADLHVHTPASLEIAEAWKTSTPDDVVRIAIEKGLDAILPGHDKTAESAAISVEYGGVPGFLVKHGYGPGGKNAIREVDRWRSKGKRRSEVR